ncbi:MAG: hypothetical protein A4E35_00367 [Methanoregula sp. PtaU1.Bin051]|nr:MAG: hypothetical protein A4E35_00367 [Methanoregula sp. PtaU1.Bin051]
MCCPTAKSLYRESLLAGGTAATAALMEEFSEDAGHIRSIAKRLCSARTKGELGTLIAEEAQKFSLFELQVIGGRMYADVEKLPSPYRERIRPYFTEQIFGAYHRLVTLHRSGEFCRMGACLNDPAMFVEFCRMLPLGCFSWDDRSERNPHFRNPRYRLFYYLMAAFSMFVLDEPGHPVGMPFPGGFTVEKRNNEFYCPIRDREKEIFYSICNFCPAKQTDENRA